MCVCVWGGGGGGENNFEVNVDCISIYFVPSLYFFSTSKRTRKSIKGEGRAKVKDIVHTQI